MTTAAAMPDSGSDRAREARSLLERARQANAARRHRRASELCQVALNGNPEPELAAALRVERAHAELELASFADAERDCRWALEHAASARAHALLARCLLERDDPASAIGEAAAALALDADYPLAYALYARALSAQQRHAEAVLNAREALRREPSAAALSLLLRVLAAAGEHSELVQLAELELAREPKNVDAWSALGTSLNALGRATEALTAFRRAVALDPERVDSSFGLASALLRIGQLSEGFRYMEHRQAAAGACFRLGVPPWRGQPIAGKRVLVQSEQGLGDTLQFARFVPLVSGRGASVRFLVPTQLRRLLGSSPELSAMLETSHPGFGGADYQTLLMSLPELLGLGEETRAVCSPYLSAEPELVAHWRARLPAGVKIALAWQGNPHFAGEPWRSMPFQELAPLLTRHASLAKFLSLQKNFGSEQLRVSPLAERVLDLSCEVDRGADAFVDSAAILASVELFITTDTSLAHLAGALGVSTWLLLPAVADWRWGLEPESTFWYPSLRLFRQTPDGGWASVVQRATDELEATLAQLAAARQSGSKSIARCAMPPQVVGTGA